MLLKINATIQLASGQETTEAVIFIGKSYISIVNAKVIGTVSAWKDQATKDAGMQGVGIYSGDVITEIQADIPEADIVACQAAKSAELIGQKYSQYVINKIADIYDIEASNIELLEIF